MRSRTTHAERRYAAVNWHHDRERLHSSLSVAKVDNPTVDCAVRRRIVAVNFVQTRRSPSRRPRFLQRWMRS
jgi:hypothetical protein